MIDPQKSFIDLHVLDGVSSGRGRDTETGKDYECFALTCGHGTYYYAFAHPDDLCAFITLLLALLGRMSDPEGK